MRNNFMWKLKMIIRQIKCNHEYYPIRVSMGDERLHAYYKSIWRCADCGKVRNSKWVDRP
nr:MAG TPA: Halobacterial output domain 2 [Caudoviricetes sp.]